MHKKIYPLLLATPFLISCRGLRVSSINAQKILTRIVENNTINEPTFDKFKFDYEESEDDKKTAFSILFFDSSSKYIHSIKYKKGDIQFLKERWVYVKDNYIYDVTRLNGKINGSTPIYEEPIKTEYSLEAWESSYDNSTTLIDEQLVEAISGIQELIDYESENQKEEISFRSFNDYSLSASGMMNNVSYDYSISNSKLDCYTITSGNKKQTLSVSYSTISLYYPNI